MLRRFQMVKCEEHCIGKFDRGWELKDDLLKTAIFEEKVLNGRN